MDIVGTTTVCGGICISEASGIVPLGVVICTRASEHTRPHFGLLPLGYAENSILHVDQFKAS